MYSLYKNLNFSVVTKLWQVSTLFFSYQIFTCNYSAVQSCENSIQSLSAPDPAITTTDEKKVHHWQAINPIAWDECPRMLAGSREVNALWPTCRVGFGEAATTLYERATTQYVSCEDGSWLELAQDGVQWKASVLAAFNTTVLLAKSYRVCT